MARAEEDTGTGFKSVKERSAERNLPIYRLMERDPFEITKYDVTCHAADVKDNYEEMEGKHVTLAGRIMSETCYGKSFFL